MAVALEPTITKEEVLDEIFCNKTIQVTTKRFDGKKAEVFTGPEAKKFLGGLPDEIREVSLRHKEIAIQQVKPTTGDLTSARTKTYSLGRGYSRKDDPKLNALAHDALEAVRDGKHVIVEPHNNRRRHISPV